MSTEEKLETMEAEVKEQLQDEDYYYGHVEPRYPKSYETVISSAILVGTLLIMGVLLLSTGVFG
ncbi:hypothetical protein R9C00_02410 [Flammeovirgaceae bacterium SG7u.111]|nr:hypothetical protein [Flammeovirgaceae bacterium SG7u.132]WPO36294.1 hypothetical protein R9C00_02410 [Flammeovirgaceae bacterium SG7u.111]